MELSFPVPIRSKKGVTNNLHYWPSLRVFVWLLSDMFTWLSLSSQRL